MTRPGKPPAQSQRTLAPGELLCRMEQTLPEVDVTRVLMILHAVRTYEPRRPENELGEERAQIATILVPYPDLLYDFVFATF